MKSAEARLTMDIGRQIREPTEGGGHAWRREVVRCAVFVSVDMEAIGQQLAQKALGNKSKTAKLANGKITVKVSPQ